MLLDTVAGPGLQLVEVPTSLGNTDHRYLEVPSFDHRLQGWKNFLIGEISGGAEEHQSVRMRNRGHELLFRWLFEMAAELKAHGGEHLVLEISFTAGTESLVERSSEHRDRYSFVDRRFDSPSTFA
jgi:hypothetical protein